MKMSKKFWALVPLALLVLTACGSSTPAANPAAPATKTDAKTATVEAFVSKEGNFSINFPGKPEVSSDKIDGDGGGFKATMTSYSYASDDNHAFLVAYTDITAGEFTKEEARKVLKDEQGGALGSFGIKAPEEEKDMDYDANSAGLRYKAKGDDGTHLIAQTYFIGNRLYQIEMLTMGAYPTDEEIKNFTGTFKVLK
ncbi:MAG: hypothetical protein NTZ25_05915 [Candidatus Peregrinibacteria bacterium]|nr:hypothetical protein [Candidatus Peregrinibacteria bacterium]